MNNHFQKALMTSRVYLVENIDYDNLRDFLIQYNILPLSTLEDTDSLENRRKKIRKILDCLPRRDDNTYPRFLISLFNSHQEHIARNLYQTTIKLIDPTNSHVKDWLQVEITKMLPSSSTCLENIPATSNTELTLTPKLFNEPVENSLSSLYQNPEPKPMESEEDYSYTNNESNHPRSPNERISAPTTSFSSQQLHYVSAYDMDSDPPGLFCIITAKEGAELKGDSVPVFEKKPTGNDALKLDNELQTLFWGFGLHSCIIELENSTYHFDKLNNIVYQFSQHPPHYRYTCCALALLGFSESDLNLPKLLSYFNEKTCPSLVGKPKLILIQLTDEKSNSSNLMSDVEIPEDSLVAVGIEDTATQPGMVSLLIQLCQPMNKSSYFVEEIFNQLQNHLKIQMTVKKTLTKQWILDTHCQPKS